MPQVYNAIYDVNGNDYFTPHKKAFSRWWHHNQPGGPVLNNAGQFVFPGGGFEAGPNNLNYYNDADFKRAALQELTEEIGLIPEFNQNGNVTRLLFNNPNSNTPRDTHFNNYVNLVHQNIPGTFDPIDVYEQNVKRFVGQHMVGGNEPLSAQHVQGGTQSTHGALYLGIDPQDFDRLINAYSHIYNYDDFVHNNQVIPQNYKRRRDEELNQAGANLPNTHQIPANRLPGNFVHPVGNRMSPQQAQSIFTNQHHIASPHLGNPHGLTPQQFNQQQNQNNYRRRTGWYRDIVQYGPY